MRIIEVYEMGNIWIFISTEYSKLIDIDRFKVNDRYSESSNCFDWDIIIFIINNYILFKVIKYTWIYIYIRIYNIIVSIFNIEFIYKVFSLKS